MPKGFRTESKGKNKPTVKERGGMHGGASSSNPNRTATSKAIASGAKLRDKQTTNRLNMYRSKIKRGKGGKIVSGGLAVGDTVKNMEAARIAPDRRWFGNTRVIGQTELSEFREHIAETQGDPYAVLVKRSRLPMGLLADSGGVTGKRGRVDLLRAESYRHVFGQKKQRKRPKLAGIGDCSDLLARVAKQHESYAEVADSNIEREVEKTGPKNYIFDAGQSRRIRHELFKVRASRLTLSPGPQGPGRDRASAPEPQPTPLRPRPSPSPSLTR